MRTFGKANIVTVERKHKSPFLKKEKGNISAGDIDP